ncbi:facilitated trehalose transporter Tret1-like [Anticarsia gemmatalis]|uniref:facilitated trehalose transporter Tret1-like n=1 Tax=Anticarsia gemmatalis TaxID=129554 RepID=UPI003F76007B
MLTALRKQIFISLLAYIGQTTVGVSLAWSAPVLPKLQDLELTPLPDVITEAQASWVASLVYIGVILGPYIGSFISNSKGRRPALLVGGILTALGFIIMAFAHHLAVIFAARIVMGLGSGLLHLMNLVYLGEIASTNIRGILLTLTACFTPFGTFLIYAAAPFMSFQGSCWLGFAISVAYIFGTFFMPESPLFLVLNDQEDIAKDSLISLGRVDEINNVLAAGKDITTTSNIQDWLEIFTIKSNRRAISITLPLGVLQQMSGVITVVFFATTIFEIAGSSIQPHIATIIIGLTQFLASTITPWFIERVGRRSLLIFSTLFVSLSLAVLGVYFLLDRLDHASLPNIGWLPLLSLITCFLAFDLGFGIIPGTLCGEMFRANVRSTGTALSGTVSSSVGFIIVTTFGYMLPVIGADSCFFIYAFISALACVFSIFFVPETRGKSLIEIQDMLSK